MDESFKENSTTEEAEKYKMKKIRDALDWYEGMLGVNIEEPVLIASKWSFWGGVYYAASLYTTIGKSFNILHFYLIK